MSTARKIADRTVSDSDDGKMYMWDEEVQDWAILDEQPTE